MASILTSLFGAASLSEDSVIAVSITRTDGEQLNLVGELINYLRNQLKPQTARWQPSSPTINLSIGNRTLQNTHPFVRTFDSPEVTFAHNGTLKPIIQESELNFHPVGETDSEYLLCALLTILSNERIPFTDFQKIEAVLREFNKYGSMNILFSEKDHLYCYRNQDGYNGLCMTKRTKPFGKISLVDEEQKIDLAEGKRPDQRGFVIATRPLADEHWDDPEPGSLKVFRDGQRVYPP